jgi:protease-4
MIINPAGIGVQNGIEFEFFHGFTDVEPAASEALLLKLDKIGLGYQTAYNMGEHNWDIYTIPLGFELSDTRTYLGAALNIYNPRNPDLAPKVDVSLGALWRLWGFFSFGAHWRNIAEPKIFSQAEHQALDLAVGIQPFTTRFEAFADFTLIDDGKDEPKPVFRARFEPLDGFVLFGNANTDGAFGVALGLDFANFGAISDLQFTDNQQFSYGSAGFRVSTYRGNALFDLPNQFVELVINENIYAERSGRFWFSFLEPEKIALDELIGAIRRARNDRAIDGIILKIEPNDLSLAEIWELREALREFKEKSNKEIYAYFDDADNKNYLLATIADKIYASPTGGVEIPGLAANMTFIKGTLDWLGVRFEAVKHGKYKSAVEPLTRTTPSSASAQAITALLDDHWEIFLPGLAAGRKKTEEEMLKLINEQAIFTAAKAREAGLIDEILYYDEVEERLEREQGRNVYIVEKYLDRSYRQYDWKRVPTIAVVEVNGAIVYGNSGFNLLFGEVVGSATIAEALNQAAEDSSVDAIVLRIDSPGGSITGSDLILREVIRARKKKPIIVSMGTLAASGGYYIACAADHIVADPFTITGSIGVFSLKLDAGELLGKIGLTHAVFKRGEHADADSLWRGYSDDEKLILQAHIDALYQEFIDRVADGRRLSPEKVDELAQGRVWSGTSAKEIGLVDEIGDIGKAIDAAKRFANIAEHRQVKIIKLPDTSLFAEMGTMFAKALNFSWEVKSAIRSVEEETQPIGGEPVYLMPYTLQVK